MTIDEFIEKGLRSPRPFPKPLRSSIRQKGFLFLVLHLREINGTLRLVVVHVTVDFEKRGKGLLTSTFRTLRYRYPELEIALEGVKEPRHQARLIRLGFEPSLNQMDFLLPVSKDMNATS